MSAMVVPEGISILGYVGGQYSDWCKVNQVGLTRSIKPDAKLLNVRYVANYLCSLPSSPPRASSLHLKPSRSSIKTWIRQWPKA